jgi:hypothetical protein
MAMTLKSKIVLSCLASAGLIATAALAQPVADGGGRPFATTLTGAEECNNSGLCGPPNAGDPDGSGTARITINPGQNRICWELTVSNIGTPTRAHIHEGAAGSNGGVRVTFFETGQPVALTGCTGDTPSPPFTRDRLTDIIQNPQNYYVNVHTAEFPAGAIRGQLSKKAN